MTAGRKLFCFGFGYCAASLARRLAASGWRVAGTSRSGERRGALGIEAARFSGDGPVEPPEALDRTTHVLVSVPPGDDGDPVLAWHGSDLAAAASVEWVGYLSTTGVYGDRAGGWVDEDSDLRPSGRRGERRVAAERSWLEWGAGGRAAVQVFRLAGIYGPGRSAIDRAREGAARRVAKPGHLFSRIHVEDVATVLEASIARPASGRVYNVCDDEPAPQSDVVAHACALLGVAPPPETPFARAGLSPAARSFWADNRRVRNDRIKTELGVELAFPDYRSGLRAIARQLPARETE